MPIVLPKGRMPRERLNTGMYCWSGRNDRHPGTESKQKIGTLQVTAFVDPRFLGDDEKHCSHSIE